jgi:hypothetical protein
MIISLLRSLSRAQILNITDRRAQAQAQVQEEMQVGDIMMQQGTTQNWQSGYSC